MQIDIAKMLSESCDRESVVECCSNGGIKHLYDDYRMTFGEMRNIFKNIFSGKTKLTEKVDGLDLLVTYKDGDFGFARGRSQLREPLKISRLEKAFTGDPKVRGAFVNSATNLVKALNSIEAKDLNRLFANGQNFARISIIYPPCRNVFDYGNRCIIQMNGIDMFDSKFNRISEDDEASRWLYQALKYHNALKQEMFEISEPNILRMKNSVSAEKALKQLLADFDKVIDGFSTKCTIKDYANERLRRCIINICNHNNIEVDRDCAFIRELADRVGRFSGRRPTKSDICTFAKRAGVDVHGDDFRKVMETLETQGDMINDEIMRPVENLVMKAGDLMLKNLSGYMSADPSKTSQKLVTELENTINEVEKDNSRLTADKLKLFKRTMKKIDNWQDRFCPCDGVVCKINGKAYKITGSFGPCKQIMNIFNS